MKLRYINYVINAILFLFIALSVGCQSKSVQPNILFIAIDDLRPQIGAYGHDFMQTPHMDALAARGFLFQNHFVAVPTCGASRFSMLTGKRPNLRSHLSNDAIRLEIGDADRKPTTWPQILRDSGYYTVALGKVGHYPDSKIYTYAGEGDGHPEMPGLWDEIWGPTDKWGTSWNAFFGYPDGSNRNTLQRQVLPYDSTATNATDLPDGLIAEEAQKRLRQLKELNQPFLLAVGFFKPHLPFNAPKKYWDLYDRSKIAVSDNPEVPQGANSKSIHNSGEMFGSYKKFPEKGGAGIVISDSSAKLLRHAYYAAVSYVDEMLGQVIRTLEEEGLAENTKIVIWGDHGWHLGDQTMWGKHSNYENAVRSTLLIVDPANPGGEVVTEVVETVDLYPTLLALAGLDAGNSSHGQNLSRILEGNGWVSKPALSYFRGGVSMRTDTHRLVWYPGDSLEYELYDHRIDPLESNNIAAAQLGIVKELSSSLADYYNGFYEDN